jgi:Cu/Ag efflux protein CusF
VNAGNLATNNSKPSAKAAPAISATPKATVSPLAALSNSVAAKKYKNYNGRGVIKKIDVAGGSIVIDHEDIGDYMVAMEMPFPVVNKKILDGLKVGDKVSFVLETGVGVERIISIRKN